MFTPPPQSTDIQRFMRTPALSGSSSRPSAGGQRQSAHGTSHPLSALLPERFSFACSSVTGAHSSVTGAHYFVTGAHYFVTGVHYFVTGAHYFVTGALFLHTGALFLHAGARSSDGILHKHIRDIQ
jgi:hypothetical protein